MPYSHPIEKRIVLGPGDSKKISKIRYINRCIYVTIGSDEIGYKITRSVFRHWARSGDIDGVYDNFIRYHERVQ